MGLDLTDIQGTSPDRVVRFTVLGEPRSKQRPRVTQRGTFTPKETLEQERRVRNAWRETGEQMFDYDMVIDIDFYNSTRHRRDIDNMAKLVLDALNEEAFPDDYRVVGLNLRKLFTDSGRARTEVAIKEVILWPNEA